MYICDSCSRIWRALCHACPSCGTVGLRPFGTDGADTRHPLAIGQPITPTEPVELPDPVGDAIAAAVGGSSAAEAGPPLPRPAARAPVEEWRAWALEAGHDPQLVADLTKAQLRQLEDRPTSAVFVDDGQAEALEIPDGWAASAPPVEAV